MNWKKGFRRIALLLSIVAAIAGAVGCFKVALIVNDTGWPVWVNKICDAIDDIGHPGHTGDYLLLLAVIFVGGTSGFVAFWFSYLILVKIVYWIAAGFKG